MELSTVARLLPQLPLSTNPSPRPRIRRPSLSPVPMRYDQLYQQLVLKEKEFIKTNRYAQMMASHFAVPRSVVKRPDLVRDSHSELKDAVQHMQRSTLGVDGLSVPFGTHLKSPLRTKLQPYVVDQSWVSQNTTAHRRTASTGSEIKGPPGTRASLSPHASKSGVTTVNISLPTVRQCKKSESVLRSEDFDSEETHGATYDSAVRRSRKLQPKAINPVTFPPL